MVERVTDQPVFFVVVLFRHRAGPEEWVRRRHAAPCIQSDAAHVEGTLMSFFFTIVQVAGGLSIVVCCCSACGQTQDFLPVPNAAKTAESHWCA